MTAVFKYQMPIEDEFAIPMPAGAKVLHVDVQNGMPHIWALVDPANDLRAYNFCVRGTGHPFRGNEGDHVGTVMLHAGALVFHVFEAQG